MNRSNPHRDVEAEADASAVDEETATLPSLSLAANDTDKTLATDQLCDKLDELIALSRSINDHLEYLVDRQKSSAWSPIKRNRP
jgi:hypothetical protein